MGLERIQEVAGRLGVLRPAPQTVIVAGTNGKGSTAVFSEALLLELGYSVGTTLSPHVDRFNERVRINGVACDDATLCENFATVETARGDIPLTYFEFSALVALQSFYRAGVDVAILEVGLGGRLDAFNIVDADVAVVTSIGVDHVDFLGSDPEQIGVEKAGVFRPGRHAVLGAAITNSVLDRAVELGCQISRSGTDFTLSQSAEHWSVDTERVHFEDLPVGTLAPENCALGVLVADVINVQNPGCAPLNRQRVLAALARAWLPGRFEELVVNDRHYILDVAHNPAGATFLCNQLQRQLAGGKGAVGLVAIIGSLRDKDTVSVIEALRPVLGQVICVGVDGDRGLAAAELAQRLPADLPHQLAVDLTSALERARSLTEPGDVILACGSFAVVGRVRSLLGAPSTDTFPPGPSRPS
jgi:dihydrofolate synthase/folylpolyglutamate synthase